MTRTISLISAIAGLALVLAVPAFGQGQQDFWNYDESGNKVTNTSPGLAPQDLASLYSGEGSGLQSPIVSPDAVDRAVAAKQLQAAATVPSPDVVERAVAARNTAGRNLVFDDHRIGNGLTSTGRMLVFDNHRIEPSTSPSEIGVTGSGRDIEWPQIGLAFGLGIVLMLGLVMVMRLAGNRPLAH